MTLCSIGMTRAGKATAGHRAADSLTVAFFDTDDEVVGFGSDMSALPVEDVAVRIEGMWPS
jgi:shikimate kinase